jgi:uncharacterized protein (DUF1015 family)
MVAAKEDRLRLMQACHANLSPVFGVYPGRSFDLDRLFSAAQSSEPAIEFCDWDGIRHRLCVCRDRGAIRALQADFASMPIFIADGHHRYETALVFRDMMRAQAHDDPQREKQRPYNYIMMTLVSAEDPGLVILPIHRLLRQLPGGVEAYIADVAQQFAVERLPVPPDAEADAASLTDRLTRLEKGTHRFVLYAGGESGYLLSLADEQTLGSEVAEGKPMVYKRLDVTILHALLIDGPLRRQGLAALPDDALNYTHDAVEAIRSVREGRWGVALLLNPTKIAEVLAVAEAGLRMPPKSTFFYPKLLTGLVINPINLDELVEP